MNIEDDNIVFALDDLFEEPGSRQALISSHVAKEWMVDVAHFLTLYTLYGYGHTESYYPKIVKKLVELWPKVADADIFSTEAYGMVPHHMDELEAELKEKSL